MARCAEVEVVRESRWFSLGRPWFVAALWAFLCVSCATVPVERAGKGGVPVRAELPDYALIWPVPGFVAAGFGPRHGGHHDGIDIRGEEGLPIVAALDGEVLFSGALRGYGNVVILGHRNALTTVYAHNQRNLVVTGTRVRRGSVIALLGRTGRAAEPNLHFEVRRKKEVRDPLLYLPRGVGALDRSPVLQGREEG